jgi:hypothetical protein
MAPMDETLTAIGVILLLLERAFKTLVGVVHEWRNERGSDLYRAFESTSGVIQQLYLLYSSLAKTEGFLSLRLLSAHNTGNELNKTMLWKSTVLATMPSSHETAEQWTEQPLDHEYLNLVLRPVVEGGSKHLRTTDLHPEGALGAMYLRQSVTQSYNFLIKKTNTEIVYATVTFTLQASLKPEQLDAIRICRTGIARHFNNGR